jgi:hypothetical protein
LGGERAKRGAETRGISVAFSVADVRKAHDHQGKEFDLVLSADNSVTHLLTDEEILDAFRQFFICTRPGGGCIMTVRDYEKEDLSKTQVKPYGIREDVDQRAAWNRVRNKPPTRRMDSSKSTALTRLI